VCVFVCLRGCVCVGVSRVCLFCFSCCVLSCRLLVCSTAGLRRMYTPRCRRSMVFLFSYFSFFFVLLPAFSFHRWLLRRGHVASRSQGSRRGSWAAKRDHHGPQGDREEADAGRILNGHRFCILWKVEAEMKGCKIIFRTRTFGTKCMQMETLSFYLSHRKCMGYESNQIGRLKFAINVIFQ